MNILIQENLFLSDRDFCGEKRDRLLKIYQKESLYFVAYMRQSFPVNHLVDMHDKIREFQPQLLPLDIQ